MTEPEKEYLTVTEFAKLAGVSRQAVQQRITTSLAEFVKTNEQGKKTIHRNALQFFGVEVVKPNEQGTTENDKANEQESKAKTQGTNNDILYTALLQTVEVLQAQLETKDKQISELNARLEQALTLTSQSHFIAAQAQQQLPDGTTPPAEESPADGHQAAQEPKKKSFFSRLFGND